MKQSRTTTHHPQACPEWAKKLSAMHHDDLPFEQRLELRAHLESCSRCQAVKSEYRAMDALITDLPPVKPLAEMPMCLQELTGVYTEAEQLPRTVGEREIPVPEQLLAHKQPPQRRFRRLIFRLNLAAAVLVVAAIIAGFLLLSNPRHFSSFATQHSTPIYLATDRADSVAYALNSDDGSIIWQHDLGHKLTGYPTAADGNLYFPSYDGDIYALRASDGQPLWHTRVSSNTQAIPDPGLLAYNHLIITGTFGGDLYALSAQTGAVAWHNHIQACTSNGTIDSSILINQKGQTTTIKSTGEPDFCDVVPLVQANGVIYGFGGTLYAWNAANGHVLWQNTRYQFNSRSLAVAQGKIYISSNKNGSIDVLKASNGAFLHTLAQSTPRFSGLQFAVNESAIYVYSNFQSSLAAYSLDHNMLLWQKSLGSAISGFSTTADVVYVGGAEMGKSENYLGASDLYALRASDNSQIWHWRNPSGDGAENVFKVNDVICFITGNGVYAVQASNGHQIWQGFQNVPVQGPVAE